MTKLEAAELFEKYSDHQSIYNLPELDQLPNPTISLHREQFKTFRNDFLTLQIFAAWACGVDVEIFCKLDMMKYIHERAEVKDGK